jgi:hypothetical protein
MKTFFANLRLPLSRGESDVITFLGKHFSFFDSEIEKLLNGECCEGIFPPRISAELKDKRGFIRRFSGTILESLKLHHAGKILDAHSIFYSIMDEIQGNLLISDIRGFVVPNRFFRIRPERVNGRKELFHIPFEKITKVKAYRYSVAGFPCLYLAGGPSDTPLSLCWIECGMPYAFSWSEYKLVDNTGPIPLINLTLSPFVSAINAQDFLTSALNHEPIDDIVIKMITSYPLMAACSLIVEDKNQNFTPEYIIPQMLLGWIRRSNKIRGVAYFSCSSIPTAKLYNAFNIALPPSQPTNVGYCEKLKNEFLLSKPKFIEISDVFIKLKDNYEQVRNFRDWLKVIYQNDIPLDTIQEIISLCDSFILLYESVSNKKKLELTWAHQYIETLSLVSNRLAGNKYFELMIEQARLISPDSDQGIEKCSDIWGKFKALRLKIIDFWNFDIKHFETSTTDFCYIDK